MFDVHAAFHFLAPRLHRASAISIVCEAWVAYCCWVGTGSKFMSSRRKPLSCFRVFSNISNEVEGATPYRAVLPARLVALAGLAGTL